jgi:hypothetical protein
MSKVVTQLKRGADLVEVMTRDGMLEVEKQHGMIVMIQSALGPTSNFHSFAPWRLAEDPLRNLRAQPTVVSREEESVFVSSLQTSWGVLGLMSSDNQTWLIRKERHLPFLRAALSHWDELEAVGSRYYVTVECERIWRVARGLKYVLANMGVPNELLTAPLPLGGPRVLLEHARATAGG